METSSSHYSYQYLSQCESKVKATLREFYDHHDELRSSKSHGFDHVIAVFNHSQKAIESILGKETRQKRLTEIECTEIRLAALMHDVDDHKYFIANNSHSSSLEKSIKNENDHGCEHEHEHEHEHSHAEHDHGKKSQPISISISISKQGLRDSYPNATEMLEAAQVPGESIDKILYMIDLVSCSKNGNSVPSIIEQKKSFHLLIPRWADRLEAIGKIGVVRCYRYNLEKGMPLFNEKNSPRPTSEEDVWRFATAERFDNYVKSGGKGRSNDMISHYYDKLLSIAKPPREIVQNEYLERAAEESSKELVEICLRYGLTGVVDVDYILELERSLLE